MNEYGCCFNCLEKLNSNCKHEQCGLRCKNYINVRKGEHDGCIQQCDGYTRIYAQGMLPKWED